MRKLYILLLASAGMMPVMAQDAYEGAKIMTTDLNGTARYVGMGGALDALGADISTIGTNPAGIGLFRHSTASVSFGVVSQQDVNKFDRLNKTNLSFDQIGFVYSSRMDVSSFINIGFNYHKSRNFDQILSVADTWMRQGGSMNKNSYLKHLIGEANGNQKYGSANHGGYYLDWDNNDNLVGYEDSQSDLKAYTYSQWDDLLVNSVNAQTDKEGTDIGYNDADVYNFDRSHRGWIADYDLNISGNINDRVYLGLTVGLHSVDFRQYSEYAEGLVGHGAAPGETMDAGTLVLADDRKVDGSGVDITAGVIFRPIEYSPFRIGLSVKTPTWYDLTTSNVTTLYNNSLVGDFSGRELSVDNAYKFKFYTPWKFGLSLGHTIGQTIAIGAGIDYADYSASSARINDGYDYYGNEDSYADEPMNDNIDRSLQGVATFKVGAELKPDPSLAVRLGYNYVSPMYSSNGVRDMTVNSPGVMYASTADYTNWDETHRITCGLGFSFGKVGLDVAYQYCATNGTFHPFQPMQYDGISSQSTTADVSNKRHQVLMTLGYTF